MSSATASVSAASIFAFSVVGEQLALVERGQDRLAALVELLELLQAVADRR